jgi:hypothetical protein
MGPNVRICKVYLLAFFAALQVMVSGQTSNEALS